MSVTTAGATTDTIFSEYDADGNLVKSKLTTSDGTNATTTYTLSITGGVVKKNVKYDKFSPGIDKSTSEASSEERTYDAAGRMTTLKDQNKKSISYTYDQNDNITTLTDFGGRLFKLEYDNMDRPTSAQSPDGLTVTNNYSTQLNDPSYGKILSRAISNDNQIKYSYDGYGYLKRVVDVGNKKAMLITKDMYGRTKESTDYAGKKVVYEYDPGMPFRVKSITKDIDGCRADFFYYSKQDNSLFGSGTLIKDILVYGQIATKASDSNIGRKLHIHYDYNTDNKQPKLKCVTTYGKDDSALISKAGYVYDGLDRVTSITETSPGSNLSKVVKSYVYNDLNQLLSESTDAGGKIYSAKYTYDIRGNLKSKNIATGGVSSTATYAYDAANHLTSYTDEQGVSHSIEWDNGKTTNGNITKITGSHERTFEYNGFNQLVKYNEGGTTLGTYTYDAEGLRKSKQLPDGNGMNYYYGNGGDVICEENIADGKMSSYFMVGDNRILRAIMGNGKVLGTQWYLMNAKDVIGTTSLKDNVKPEQHLYDAYGQQLDASNNFAVKGKKGFNFEDNPYLYSGYPFDAENGMYYCKARYYLPEMGSFLTGDSYDVANRFAYCGNDPINNLDSDGHSFVGAIVKTVVGTLLMAFGSSEMARAQKASNQNQKVAMTAIGAVAIVAGLALTCWGGADWQGAGEARAAKGAADAATIEGIENAEFTVNPAAKSNLTQGDLDELIGTSKHRGKTTSLMPLDDIEATRAQIAADPGPGAESVPELLKKDIGRTQVGEPGSGAGSNLVNNKVTGTINPTSRDAYAIIQKSRLDSGKILRFPNMKNGFSAEGAQANQSFVAGLSDGVRSTPSGYVPWARSQQLGITVETNVNMEGKTFKGYTYRVRAGKADPGWERAQALTIKVLQATLPLGF
jgi:RHS repeat-associated protein